MAGDFESGGIKQFITGIETSAKRLKTNFETIYEKYDRPFPDSDLINISTLSICRDKGSVRKLRNSHHFGTSKLASTKRKEEICRSQMGLSKCQIDSNVSRAIARRCVSYLNDTAKEEQETEPSDAETLSSDSSDDDIDGEEEAEDERDSDVKSDEDESVDDEVENDRSDNSVLDDADADVVVIGSSQDESADDSINVKDENRKLKKKPRQLKCVKSYKYEDEESDNVDTDSMASPVLHRPKEQPTEEDSMVDSNNHASHYNHLSPGNVSITSSFKNLSFVSIQSPNRSPLDHDKTHNRRLSGSLGGSKVPKVLQNTFDVDSASSVFNRKENTKNKPPPPDKLSCLSNLEMKRKAIATQETSLDANAKASHSLSVLQTFREQKMRSPKLSKSIENVDRNAVKSATTPNALKNSLQSYNEQNTEKTRSSENIASDETFVVPVQRSPVKAELPSSASATDGVFKSPQNIKVMRRVCPTPVSNGRHYPPSPLQDSLSSRKISILSAMSGASPQESPKNLSDQQHLCVTSKRQSPVGTSPTAITFFPPVPIAKPNTSIPCEDSLSSRKNSIASAVLGASPPKSPKNSSDQQYLHVNQFGKVISFHSSTFSPNKRRNVSSSKDRISSEPVANKFNNPFLPFTDVRGNKENKRISGLQQHKKSSPNDKAPSLTMSFSSGEDELPQDIAESYSFILKSSPPYVRQKRKASDSCTSGYYTDASASPGFVCANGCSSSGEQIPVNCHDHLQQSDNLPGHQTCPSVIVKPSALIDLKARHNAVFGHSNFVELPSFQGLNIPIKPDIDFEKARRRFAVAKKRLGKSKSIIPHGEMHSHNQDSLQNKNSIHASFCKLHSSVLQQQIAKQQPLLQDSRVHEWVVASRLNTATGPACHYASCPPKLPREFQTSDPGYTAKSHHQPWLSHNTPESSSPASSKRDIGIQATLIPSMELLESKFQCNFSHPRFVSPFYTFQQSNKTSRGVMTDGNDSLTNVAPTIKSSSSNLLPSCRQCESSLGSQQPFGRNSMSKSQMCENNSTNSSACIPLQERAASVWREIQVEKATEKTYCDDFETSIVEDVHPKSALSKCETYDVMDQSLIEEDSLVGNSSLGCEEQRFSRFIPKISCFMKERANPVLSGAYASKSFVENHSPKPAVNNTASTPSCKSSAIVTPVPNAMFPHSYIEKFCPSNPKRMDSDSSAFRHEQERAANHQSLKQCLKTFRPRRNCQSLSLNKCTAFTKKQTTSSRDVPTVEQPAMQNPFQDKPPKLRRISDYSSHSSQNVRPAFFHSPETYNSNAAMPVQESAFLQNKHNFVKPCQPPRKSNLAVRASTPVKTHFETPSLSLDETVSTILPSNIGDLSSERVSNSDNEDLESTVVRHSDSNSEDSDSSDSISFL